MFNMNIYITCYGMRAFDMPLKRFLRVKYQLFISFLFITGEVHDTLFEDSPGIEKMPKITELN